MTEKLVARPVEVDRQLAEIWTRQRQILAQLESAKLSLASNLGIRPYYVTKTRRAIRETAEQLLEMAAAKLATDELTPWKRTDVEAAVERYTTLKVALDTARAAADPLETEYHEARWSRFFLVTNANGHIHSSMSCSTCNPRTAFAWLPDLSGMTEADAVAAHGPRLCTVCYPSAPVEWTVGETAEADPTECIGTGTRDYDQASYRRTSYHGNGAATCTHCGQRVGVTTTGKIRKHRNEATTA